LWLRSGLPGQVIVGLVEFEGDLEEGAGRQSVMLVDFARLLGGDEFFVESFEFEEFADLGCPLGDFDVGVVQSIGERDDTAELVVENEEVAVDAAVDVGEVERIFDDVPEGRVDREDFLEVEFVDSVDVDCLLNGGVEILDGFDEFGEVDELVESHPNTATKEEGGARTGGVVDDGDRVEREVVEDFGEDCVEDLAFSRRDDETQRKSASLANGEDGVENVVIREG
jgi:hypothetical protein